MKVTRLGEKRSALCRRVGEGEGEAWAWGAMNGGEDPLVVDKAVYTPRPGNGETQLSERFLQYVFLNSIMDLLLVLYS